MLICQKRDKLTGLCVSSKKFFLTKQQLHTLTFSSLGLSRDTAGELQTGACQPPQEQMTAPRPHRAHSRATQRKKLEFLHYLHSAALAALCVNTLTTVVSLFVLRYAGVTSRLSRYVWTGRECTHCLERPPRLCARRRLSGFCAGTPTLGLYDCGAATLRGTPPGFTGPAEPTCRTPFVSCLQKRETKCEDGQEHKF